MTPFDQAIQLSNLAARGQIARFGLRGQEEWHQTVLPVALPALPAANDRPEACEHAGTGRAPQRRLFGGGWGTVCTRCGREG